MADFTILEIIGIIATICVIIGFIINNFYNKIKEKRKILKKYFSVVWKNSKSVKPDTLLEPFRMNHFIPSYYYDEQEVVKQIIQKINENQSILVKGKPLAGKSRAIIEALRKIEKNIDVLIPKCTNFEQDFFIPKHLKFWKEKIMIIDNLEKFIEKIDIERLFNEVLKKFYKTPIKAIKIVATCRTGMEYESLENIAIKKRLSLKSIFNNNIIEIKDISREKAEEIFEKVKKELKNKGINGIIGEKFKNTQFDGTVGSIFFQIEEMERRYNYDCDDEERRFLRIIKILYSCGIYEGIQNFPLEWIKKVAQNSEPIINENLTEYEWLELINTLEKRNYK